ncbi:MAG: hypothetical protein IJ896_03060 [Fibrobacter sp.]|jgi:hypothetical protein|nr:hypothetical protein [Fibrobacter sp.]
MKRQQTIESQKKEYVKPETMEVTFFYQQSLLNDASCEGGVGDFYCENGD